MGEITVNEGTVKVISLRKIIIFFAPKKPFVFP